ncbi:MAG: thermonuclease family protein [Acidobacteria bacterium]|nr:thermonuclease family protein [Acidobacteriota bacterium]
MKKFLILTIAFAFILQGAFLLFADEEGKVTKVYEGDRIKVKIDGKSYKVQLLGVDTPKKKWGSDELTKYVAKAAKKYTIDQIKKKNVTLKADKKAGDKNKSGDLLRYVYIGKTHINAELLKQGYGKVNEDLSFSQKTSFKKYESKAKKDGEGLWGEPKKKVGVFAKLFGNSDEEEDEDIDEDASAPASKATAVKTSSSGEKREYADTGKWVFVTKSGEKYHRKDCGHIANSQDIEKITVEEAKKRGLEPCKTCNPPK